MEIDLNELVVGTHSVNPIIIRAGVSFKWKVPSYSRGRKITNYLQIIFVDGKGCKIQGSVSEGLVQLFENKLVQNHVYVISNFSVVQNLGSYRTTSHPCRIVFQIDTEVCSTGNFLRPLDGLSLICSSELKGHQHDDDILVDAIGLMTGVSVPKEYNSDAKMVKLLFLELSDVSGVLRCVLSGKFVDSFTHLMGRGINERHVLVFRFAKIKMFLGYPTLVNVGGVSQIFVNPKVRLTHEFKERITSRGISISLPVSEIKPENRIFREADFLLFYPMKTIYDLNSMIGEGFFAVSATLNGCIEDDNWWYPEPTVRRLKPDESNSVNNGSTVDYVYHLAPRYKVKFSVFDGTDEAVFVLFNNDLKSLLKKQCGVLVKSAKGNEPNVYPTEFQSLLGMKLLFMVEKESTSNPTLDGSYKVWRVCSNSLIIDLFDKKDVKLDFDHFPRLTHANQSKRKISDS